MRRFENKVVIVTGSSSGIGAATVVLFAKEGANVTITGRNAERVERTRNAIIQAGISEDHIHCVIADLTDPNGRQRIVDTTIEKWKRLDILVNNAGASITYGKEGFEASEEAYAKTLDINLNSVLQLIKVARPHLINSKGEIVNVSSISALSFGFVQTPYYAVAKAGLDQLTRALAVDLIEHGVRVNGVSPGIVRTSFMEAVGLTKEQTEKIYAFYGTQKHSCPRGSCAEPIEIANVIAFLADRSVSSFIIGQTIVADGGTSLIMGAYTYDFKKVISS